MTDTEIASLKAKGSALVFSRKVAGRISTSDPRPLYSEADFLAMKARAEAAEAAFKLIQRTQSYSYIAKDGRSVLARELEDRAEAAEAELAEANERAADNLRMRTEAAEKGRDE